MASEDWVRIRTGMFLLQGIFRNPTVPSSKEEHFHGPPKLASFPYTNAASPEYV